MTVRFLKVICLLVVATSFSACQKVVLLQELEQRDASEIMVLLAKNGIKVDRQSVEKQQQTTWTLNISAADEQRARELLQDNNLPRQKELGLSGVCKETGLIPTPKMEKCRELLALKGEIINSLQTIPGVIDADVVINIPDKEDFPDENTAAPRPSASVVVQVDDSVQGSSALDEEKVKQFVASAITGLDIHDVAVIISHSGKGASPKGDSPKENLTFEDGKGIDPNEEVPVDGTNDESVEEEFVSVGGIEMKEESVNKFKLLISIILILFVVLSGSLIVVLLKLAQSRRGVGFAGRGSNPQLPEKVAVDHLVEEAGGQRPRG